MAPRRQISLLTIAAPKKPIEIRNSFQALAERDILDSEGKKAEVGKSLGDVMRVKTHKPKGGRASKRSSEPAEN